VPGDPDELVLPEPISVAAVVRRSGPRLVRDGFGPLAIFFLGWKLIGLTAGVAMAAAFGAAVFVHERRSGRPAMVVRLALVLVAIRASVGLSSGDATTYLAQEIGIDALLTAAVLGSLATRRPFASWFSAEFVALPGALTESETFRAAMRRITVVWGLYFLCRGLVRLAALLTLSTDRFALVIGLTDAPFLVALLAWSVYSTTSAFRRSDQWGPLLAAAEAPPQAPPAAVASD
jgi:intracellular septation protein A